MKKTIAILSALAMISGFAGVMPAEYVSSSLTAGAEDNEDAYDALEYVIMYEEWVNIIGCDEDAVEIVIPSEIEGLPVQQISDYAFQDHTNLNYISIGEGVSYIGYYAFSGCTDLMYVELPDSVTFIGQEAFANNVNLEQITLPEGLKEIGSGAFADCSSLKSITIPDSVTTLDSYAFSNCRALTDVKLSNKLTEINNSTFADCVRLTTVSIPDRVSSVGAAVFSGCKSLRSVEIPLSVYYLGEIPGNGWYGNVFADCDALTDIYYAGTEDDWKLIDLLTEIPEGVVIHYAEKAPSTGGTVVGDHNHDGIVDASDATVILQYCAALGAGITKLPLDEWYALQIAE